MGVVLPRRRRLAFSMARRAWVRRLSSAGRPVLSAAASRLNRRQGRETGELPSVTELLTAVEEGDRAIVELMEGAARVHGWIAHQLALLFDPERIVLAGPLVESATYLTALKQTVGRLPGGIDGEKIVCSTLGPFAGAIGAAALAFHHWVPGR